MGIFNSLFGKNESDVNKVEKKTVPWIALTHIEQLEVIEKKSAIKPQFIFKHSTTCGISSMVLRMFKQNYNLSAEQADLYYLDLHSHRNISDETGYKFQVLHQSPQLVVIKNGSTVAHASHGAISEIDVEKYL